jgi:biotin transport system substrate-specific component
MEGRERALAKEGVRSASSAVSRSLWLIPLMTLLTALGALVRVPIPGTPVPATMQTFFVLISGGVGGAGVGFLSQALYLSLGFCGVPFFAGGMGALGFPLPPTFGYLVGFVAAATVMGTGRNAREGILLLALKGTAAVATVYISGASYLMLTTGIDAASAFTMGIFPFIAWDLLKVLLAAFTIRKFRDLRG